MAQDQAAAFARIIQTLSKGRAVWLHHGDCVGADAQAHEISLGAGCQIYLHPPDVDDFRAFCQGADIVWALRPYLKRNEDIVKASAMLVATPGEFKERVRSGVWSTVRKARKARKPVLTVWPDGSARLERAEQPPLKLGAPVDAQAIVESLGLARLGA